MRTELTISDHALVRYLERVHGIDFAPHRADLLDIGGPAMLAGASGLHRNGLTYFFKDRTLVTIQPGRHRFIDRQGALTRRAIAFGEARQ